MYCIIKLLSFSFPLLFSPKFPIYVYIACIIKPPIKNSLLLSTIISSSAYISIPFTPSPIINSSSTDCLTSSFQKIPISINESGGTSSTNNNTNMPSGDKASLNFPIDATSILQPPIPVVTRQHSYTTLSRLIRAASIDNHNSPGTPSPAGAAQLRAIVQRLEDIDNESRQLLQRLFSMLEDARLERYLRRRLDDPKVSRMWELVEQVLDSQKGEEPLDLEQMLGSETSTGGSSSDGGSGSGRYDGGRGELSRLHKLATDKGLKMSEQDMMGLGDGYDDELKVERFKIRTLEPGGGVDSGVAQPTTDQTKDKGGSGG